MKIALQITTSTLGDMVIEEADEKTTTNPEDQKAIVVELLIQAIAKVTAAYKIPKEMLDFEEPDNSYKSAHTRKVEQDKNPRYSSAEANRRAQEQAQLSTQDDESCCSTGTVCSCLVVEEEKARAIEGECRCPHDHEPEVDGDDTDESDGLMISEEELEVVQRIVMLMRGKNV